MNTPSGHDEEVQYGRNIIKAAEENMQPHGCFRHLVLSSILQPTRPGIGPHATGNIAIEQLILMSKIAYTISHFAPLMDEVITADYVAGTRKTLTTLLDPNMAFSYISRRDVGTALAKILTGREKHFYTTYKLVGTPVPLNMHEIAAKVTHVLKQYTHAVKMDIVCVPDSVRTGELPDWRLQELEKEAGVAIPPLNIGSPRMSQPSNSGAEQVVQSSASLTGMASGYDGQRETTMSRRHALPPDEPRPTPSELEAEDHRQENVTLPRDQDDTRELHHPLCGQDDMSMAQAKRILAGVEAVKKGENSERTGRMDSLADPTGTHTSMDIRVGESTSSRPVSPPTHAEIHGPPPPTASSSAQPNASSSTKGKLSATEEQILSLLPEYAYAYPVPGPRRRVIDPRITGTKEESIPEILFRRHNGHGW